LGLAILSGGARLAVSLTHPSAAPVGVGLLCNLMMHPGTGGHPIMLNLTPLPTCNICNKPVTLETSKTDEHGKAVHEGCYVLKVSEKRAPKA
jgi:hypothetical protein